VVSRFQVGVERPAVTHEVSLTKVREWVGPGSSNPAEVTRRRRFKELLEKALPA